MGIVSTPPTHCSFPQLAQRLSIYTNLQGPAQREGVLRESGCHLCPAPIPRKNHPDATNQEGKQNKTEIVQQWDTQYTKWLYYSRPTKLTQLNNLTTQLNSTLNSESLSPEFLHVTSQQVLQGKASHCTVQPMTFPGVAPGSQNPGKNPSMNLLRSSLTKCH